MKRKRAKKSGAQTEGVPDEEGDEEEGCDEQAPGRVAKLVDQPQGTAPEATDGKTAGGELQGMEQALGQLQLGEQHKPT